MRSTMLCACAAIGAILSSRAVGDDLLVPDQYATIQAAINAAEDGDRVLVAAGTYVETIDLGSKVISVQSLEGAAATIIDGAGNGTVVRAGAADGSPAGGSAGGATLEGLTITGGNGSFLETSPGAFHLVGGGLLNDGASTAVRSCIFSGNTTSRDQNGIVAEGTTVLKDLFFETFSVVKDVRVCVDPPCGGTSTAPMDAACDPFPDDGLYTYLYTLRSETASFNQVIGWRLGAGFPGAIVDAGFLLSDGDLIPCEIEISDDGSNVNFWFFGDDCSELLDPGETACTMYVVSPVGPGTIDTTIYGDGALDAVGTCLGPARPTETIEASDEFFGTLDVRKSTVVFADAPCLGAAGSGVAGDIDENPFAEDGYFTYVYEVANLATSAIDVIGWRFDSSIPGAILGAGTIGTQGTEVCDVQISADLSQVEFFFIETAEGPAGAGCRGLLEPGESSRSLYIVSEYGPDKIDYTVYGDGAVDIVGRCLGPAVAPDTCLARGGAVYNRGAVGGAATPSFAGCLFGDNASGAGVDGLIGEATVEVVEQQFGSYSGTRSVRVCSDPVNGESPCDPFPNDGLLTYVYQISNDADSINSMIGWQIFTSTPGAVIDAGFLDGPGIVPDYVLVEGDASKVEWAFFSDRIDPGEQSVELYVISNLRPSQINAAVFGDGALDVPAPSIGPTGNGECTGRGGAMYNDGAHADLRSCTLTRNFADEGAAVYETDDVCSFISNSIVWNNGPDALDGPLKLIEYSDVEGGWPGDGNIDEDPIFLMPGSGNFRLNPGSPCIDAARNATAGVSLDLDNAPRFVDDPGVEDTGDGRGPIADMGAYEFQDITPLTCQWDLVINLIVDEPDLNLVIANYGDPGGPGDGDGNGVVDVDDLIGVIVNWGECELEAGGVLPRRPSRLPKLDDLITLMKVSNANRQAVDPDAELLDVDEVVDILVDEGLYDAPIPLEQVQTPRRGRRRDGPVSQGPGPFGNAGG